MAKKKVRRKVSSRARQTIKTELTARDKRTLGQLTGLADGVVAAAHRQRDPFLDIPTRSLSNVRYNKTKRFIEMGKNTNRRQLFNLSQAKSYMQTMLVASGAKQLIEQGKTTSIRGLYYLLKHTIEGAKEETFDDQSDCDPVIEDVEVTLNAPSPRTADHRGGQAAIHAQWYAGAHFAAGERASQSRFRRRRRHRVD